MRENTRIKNVFADKATLVARKMLINPKKKWVVRNFTGQGQLSLGMAQEVLDTMEKRGYVERIKKGPRSYTVLTNKENLIADWLKAYQFDLNKIYTYYTPDRDILKRIKEHLKDDQYALTMHTGANLITTFVKTEDVSFYLHSSDRNKDILALRQKLGLKELVRGGNIHIIKPFYKTTVFLNKQKIKGLNVVSNLQLYLDLYNFQPRGREHAEYFKKLLEEKGKHLD
jgi:hypothetical protein